MAVITRHFVRVGGRYVHYRRAGSGAPLLMAHRSPRSSLELQSQMERWSTHFTCIAPDTPGFGQSDPLPGEPDIADYADAIVAFLDALGIERIAAYGVHSGGMILINALHRHADRFSTVASIGYALVTQEEAPSFQGPYLPPLKPSPYGEHLTWLWNRVLEQSWFYPWFDAASGLRLPFAHDDVNPVDTWVRDLLEAGDNYRIGYAAILRAPHEMPRAPGVPVLIAANLGDPLQPHLSRLRSLPDHWRAETVASLPELEALCLDHLKTHSCGEQPSVVESAERGFSPAEAPGFDGLIHWEGNSLAEQLVLHAPGRSSDLLKSSDGLRIDLPGHGLSDDWHRAPECIEMWVEAVAATLARLSARPRVVLGEGLSALLAAAVARRINAAGWGGVEAHLPLPSESDRWRKCALPAQTPDRFGNYLTAGWSSVRAAEFFWPWFEARAANAIPIKADTVTPEALAARHLSLIRARSGQALLTALLTTDRHALVAAAPHLTQWQRAEWAPSRGDLWSPTGVNYAFGEPVDA